jgi:capsular polysaccharide biosynthesis protein
VLPKEQEYIAFVPQFYYLHSITTESTHFYHAVNRFRSFYGTRKEKTLPVVYVRRSEKENYALNSRKFLNMEPVLQMLKENSVTILDVDQFTSLQPQVDIILRAKVIVVEMGSALLINGCLFATDSHILVLNDFENLTESKFSYIQVYKKLLLDHNNTYELFLSKSKHTTDSFHVDIDRLRSRIRNCTNPILVKPATQYPVVFPFGILQTTSNNPKHIYCLLDTKDASDCVGHWIWECAIFLPYVQTLRRILANNTLTILLCNKKRYKRNILQDFHISESDIAYSESMTGNSIEQSNHVVPMESEYVAYVPHFLYFHGVTTNTTLFFHYVNTFRSYYMKVPLEKKTIDVLYVRRSKKEHYKGNFRHCMNMDETLAMMERNGVTMMDVDEFSSLQPQFDMVLRSKVIIAEMGSAYSINGCFLATNSHIIVLNDYNNLYDPFHEYMRVQKKLMLDHNNTFESFVVKHTEKTPFSIDVDQLETRIYEIRKGV